MVEGPVETVFQGVLGKNGNCVQAVGPVGSGLPRLLDRKFMVILNRLWALQRELQRLPRQKVNDNCVLQYRLLAPQKQ